MSWIRNTAAGHPQPGAQDQLPARGGGPAPGGRSPVLPKQGSQGQAQHQARPSLSHSLLSH
jgi:hypothetical protein